MHKPCVVLLLMHRFSDGVLSLFYACDLEKNARLEVCVFTLLCCSGQRRSGSWSNARGSTRILLRIAGGFREMSVLFFRRRLLAFASLPPRPASRSRACAKQISRICLHAQFLENDLCAQGGHGASGAIAVVGSKKWAHCISGQETREVCEDTVTTSVGEGARECVRATPV